MYNMGIRCSSTRLAPPRMEVLRMPTDSSYSEIELSRGLKTKVDADMLPVLIQWNWHASCTSRSKGFYAVRRVSTGGKYGPFHSERMHRIVVGIDRFDTRQVDHINGDTLDNRRVNLRVVDASTNSFNRDRQRNNTSGYVGVTFHKQTGK